jgi:hypothetical protein
MSADLSIAGLQQLAALPRPLDAATGHIHYADVLNGSSISRKRKRPEIAIAVDGEGINIYDVSTFS